MGLNQTSTHRWGTSLTLLALGISGTCREACSVALGSQLSERFDSIGDNTIRHTDAIKLFDNLWGNLNAMVRCFSVFPVLGRVPNHGGRG